MRFLADESLRRLNPKAKLRKFTENKHGVRVGISICFDVALPRPHEAWNDVNSQYPYKYKSVDKDGPMSAQQNQPFRALAGCWLALHTDERHTAIALMFQDVDKYYLQFA